MANAYHQLRDTSLDRRQRRYLNPITEEDCGDDDRAHRDSSNQKNLGQLDVSHQRIEAWLSPMSDHFPTPKGVHYLAAPILPSSPSSSSAGGSSPTTFSSLWARASITTDVTEFEDLYDISDEGGNDEENDKSQRLRRSSSIKRRSRSRPLSGKAAPRPTSPANPAQPHGSTESGPDIEMKKEMASKLPMVSSAEIPMSPAQMEFMGKQQALLVPEISAPPSLDGSLTSDQLAIMSSPSTPVAGNGEDGEEPWSGVHLQPGALATLHALSSGEGCDGLLGEQLEQVGEVSQAPPVLEMQQQPFRLARNASSQTSQRRTHARFSRQSLADLTRLDIPSPGGFFGGLSPRTRNTWHPPTSSPSASEALVPPTSTTAEQFYRCPWNVQTVGTVRHQQSDPVEDFYRGVASNSSAPVERVIQVSAVNDDDSDNLPTAKPFIQLQTFPKAAEAVKSPTLSEEEVVVTEIVPDYDPNYARKQQLEALSSLDRTELWLTAQRAYLKGVDGIASHVPAPKAVEETVEEVSVVEMVEEARPERKQRGPATKKTVRFSDIITSSVHPVNIPLKNMRQESAYYRAFQDYIVRRQPRDVFVHGLSRFEALQAQRVSLRSAHHNQLLGKYQLSVLPQSAKKRLSANVARGDDTLTDDPEKLRREKEIEAMNQMTMALWHVAAVKFLNGGRLITAPVTKRLARLSRMAPGEDGVARDRARILDLGGQSTCDWAWHCALQYPNTKIYTATTKAVRQLSNSNIRGPSNHRQVAVERLTKLPFADSQFDLVYARELHSLLKVDGENGEDEWETCLRECMRVLKPGGYLEFSLLDSDIMNAGPLGLAKSVEFGYTLKTLGYDPSPTKLWLGRLARAGFQDVRRAWLCLPLGAKPAPPAPPKHDSAISQVKVCQLDAMVMGSTDNIANVCSIAAGWNWERWLLRCEMEKVAGELRLADTVTASPAMTEAGKCLRGVSAVMEEGRNCRAGFRMLNGYARKPLAESYHRSLA